MKILTPEHLEAYSQCPKYFEFSEGGLNIRKSRRSSAPYLITRDIIMSCYRDLALLNTKPHWKTIRHRINSAVLKYLPDVDVGDFSKVTVDYLSSLREWYLNRFRDGPEECLFNLEVQTDLPGLYKVRTTIDAITVDKAEKVSLLVVTDENLPPTKILNNFSIRTKIWLLSKEGVKIDAIDHIYIKTYNIVKSAIQTRRFILDNNRSIIEQTDKALTMLCTGIQNRIFYPSVTEMCKTCPYKYNCRW